LAFEPVGRSTDITLALDRLNRTIKRRAIIFLISDFMVPATSLAPGRSLDFEQALLVTNRRHDLVAVTVTDPRELVWPAVGLVALKDAETGATTWVDSGAAAWREAFTRQATARQAARDVALTRAQVDRIDVTVGQDYVAPILAFFEMRARRLRR
jgi:hypothetical protein